MNEKLLEVLSEVFGLTKEKINIDMTKDDIDNWDSLKQMDLVTSIEKSYSVELDIQDIIKMKSVKDIINVIESKIN